MYTDDSGHADKNSASRIVEKDLLSGFKVNDYKSDFQPQSRPCTRAKSKGSFRLLGVNVLPIFLAFKYFSVLLE